MFKEGLLLQEPNLILKDVIYTLNTGVKLMQPLLT